MKKTLSLILALLMVAMLSTGVMAKSDNANARANSNKAKAVTSQKQQPPGQAKKNLPAPGQQKKNLQAPGQQKEKLQNSKQVEKVQKAEKKLIRERVKKSLQEKYRDSDNCQLKKAFVDTQQHWAGQCINEMTAIGLLKGYPDGTFKPDQKLNQAEALSLIMRIAEDATDEDADEDVDEDKDEDDGELTDVPAWVRGDVDKAAKKGVIKLNRFHSAVQASRAQTAVMIAKALDLDPVDTSELPFKDGILISKEDVGYILALQQEGIISGNPNGNFNPNSAITRAEMASILQRLLDQEEKGEIISVTLPETATVEQGKSITLKATVKYADDSTDNNVKWSSSDTTLATVKDGVVNAAADKTGTVTITATATRGEFTKSASCKVTIVEEKEIIAATLKATDRVGSHEGKIYEEYALKADGKQISLNKDSVKSITLQKDNADAVKLTPNTDSTLWFNVQRETGKYTLKMTDQDDKSYEATLDWVAPVKVAAIATGNSGKHDGNSYIEFKLGALDLSSFDHMYQIKPDGQVAELTVNSDSTLWFKTNNQVAGEHIFLININHVWYSSSITI